jgi:hypothetical protein
VLKALEIKFVDNVDEVLKVAILEESTLEIQEKREERIAGEKPVPIHA